VLGAGQLGAGARGKLTPEEIARLSE
jgi:hypothetical protein